MSVKSLGIKEKDKLISEIIDKFEKYLKSKGVTPDMVQGNASKKGENKIITGYNQEFLYNEIDEHLKILSGKLPENDNASMVYIDRYVINNIYSSFCKLRKRCKGLEWDVEDGSNIRDDIMEILCKWEQM